MISVRIAVRSLASRFDRGSSSKNTAGLRTMYTTGETTAEWDLSGLRDHYRGWLCRDGDFAYSDEELAKLTREDLNKLLIDRATKICTDKEARYGSPMMRELERVVLLKTVDMGPQIR